MVNSRCLSEKGCFWVNNENILLVDDEKGLLELLEITLRKEHFNHITCASTATEALEKIKNEDFDLLILDVNLPDFSGFDLCQEVRRHTLAPIIFLTARDSTFDKLSGLAIGGDDYITKPFEPLEVIARVKALLRRQGYSMKQTEIKEPAQADTYDYGRFVLNTQNGTLLIEGKPVECTAKEYDLLVFFCKHPNRVFAAAQLYEAVWDSLGVGDDKAVTMQISRLRKKIGDDGQGTQMIQNLRGIGYKFVPPVKGE